MGSFFELAFPDIDFNQEGDTKTLCPFPHKTNSGEDYYEDSPSMIVDIEKGIYHCFGCERKGNELKFIKDYMGTSIQGAIKLKKILDESVEDISDWEKAVTTLKRNPDIIEKIKNDYHFNDETITKLRIGVESAGKGISFPVFAFGKLLDVISYNPENQPKYKKRPNSTNGIIMPFDEWIYNHRRTFIVAGQKDLGIALSKGLNAIAITGGEGEIPEMFLGHFTGRNVIIIFDNDQKGREGSVRLATAIKPFTKSLKILDLSETCVEKGEDLFDFFVKYSKTVNDLKVLIKNTKEFSEEDYQIEREKIYPTVTLAEAVKPKNLNKILRSNIQVIATEEQKFIMPTVIEGTKTKSDDSGTSKLTKGSKIYWEYKTENAKELFYLVDSNLKEKQIYKNILEMMYIPNEKNVSLKNLQYETVYKCDVTDYFEKMDLENDKSLEFVAYSIGFALESGKKYKVTYKLVPHPYQGNSLYMVIFDIEQSEDSVSNFKMTDSIKESLKLFQKKPNQNIRELLDNHIEKVKGLVEADFDNRLIESIDLFMNTPLMFNLGKQKNIRAYLDILVISETRTGKSTTARKLNEVYGLGAIVPLNGANASIAGIVGGSHKTKNGFQIRAGVIPRSHKGAVIFEELGKAKDNIQRELTEIRSSQVVTITRVSGSISLPAYVRMLALTNPKADGSAPRPISSYPNGVEIVTDLIGTAEDIARYDAIVVIPEKSNKEIDPFFEPEKPFPIQAYKDRIRWIWSRSADKIEVSNEVYVHTAQKANELNKTYDSHIKLFGTEARFKILRFAIAIAGYTVSTDDDFEKIIVTKEHIDCAVDILVNLYDNPTFRFKQFVDEERKFKIVNDKGTEVLNDLWQQSSAILLHLEAASKVTQRNLQISSGLDHITFSEIINRLTMNSFIRFDGHDIVPTEKFRKTMETITREDKTPFINVGKNKGS